MKSINKKQIISFILAVILVLSLTGCDFIDGIKGIYDDAAGKTVTVEESREDMDYRLFSSMHDMNSILLSPYTAENNLCVTQGDVAREGFDSEGLLSSSALFDISNNAVLEAENCFTQLYPASTTKLMTAYLALKYGNLDDYVTVSPQALDLEPGAQVCGLEAGDTITLRDLLFGLLLHSGNDAANAVAEHIGGTISDFVNMMNQQATEFLMSNTHYTNPSGLHEDDLYTTAYDLYLIMNECIKNETFTTILDTPSYTGTVTHESGYSENITWNATNYYFAGYAAPPENITVMGGKTGTTDQAGACLVLLSRSASGNPYISIILGALNKDILYDKMTMLLSTIQ